MEKKQEFIINILYYGIILTFGYLGLKFLLPILLPFLIAFIIVWVLKQGADYLAGKLGCGCKPVLLGLLAMFYLLVGFLVFRLSVSVVPAIGNFILKMPGIYEDQILPAVQGLYLQFDDALMRTSPDMELAVEQTIDQVLANVGTFITESSGSIVKLLTSYAVSIPSVTIKIILTVVSSFFLAGDHDYVVGFVMKLLPVAWRDQVQHAARQTSHIIFIFLRSYSFLMTITFLELLVGLSLLKIPYAALLSLMIAVFDILPVLGTGGILVPWAMIAAVMGNYRMAAGIGVLYLIITAVRNSLEPRVVGKQIGLHPLATLISMFVGAGMFGVVGLFGFPVVLSVVVRMKSLEEAEAEK